MKELLKAVIVSVAILALLPGCEPNGKDLIEVQPQQKTPPAVETQELPATETLSAAKPQELPAAEPNEPNEPEIAPAPVPHKQEEKLPEVAPQPSRADEFNAALSPIFENYVDKDGLVDYAKLRRMRLVLNTAIDKFSGLKHQEYDKWSREEKIAFWVNAYNIFTLRVVVDNYPIKPVRYKLLFNYPANSIAHISNFWSKDYFNVMGTQYTLREIERDVLLKEFGEARICFAVSYATGSSAPMRNEAFLGGRLNEQLDEQAKKFFAKTNAFEIGPVNKTVYISTIFTIFDRHKEAFLNQYGTNKNFREQKPIDRAALNCIKNYISANNADYLLWKKYVVEYIKYDWTLNDQNK